MHGGKKMLKLSLKQGQYVNIGDDIRVVYVGGSGNHARLLIDAPRELNIARSTTEENPARRERKPIMQSRAFPERHSRKLRGFCGTSG